MVSLGVGAPATVAQGVDGSGFPRVQTDLTQTSRNGQELSTQFVQQFQNAELGTIGNELRGSVFEETDPTEYEMTMQLVNLTRLPVDVRFHPELLHYDLDSGHVLVQPEKDTTVNCAEGKVEIGAGAVAAVLKTEHGVTILDLYDEHKGDVKVIAGGEVIVMTPGMQITLTKHPSKELRDVHPARFIGHRNLKQIRAADGTRVFMADFSMFAAIAHMKRIRDLARSKNKNDRKLFDKIMKTAASITVLRGLQGRFTLL
jgi:hypothetical protein